MFFLLQVVTLDNMHLTVQYKHEKFRIMLYRGVSASKIFGNDGLCNTHAEVGGQLRSGSITRNKGDMLKAWRFVDFKCLFISFTI